METEITVEVFNNLEEIKNILNEKGFWIINEFTLTDYYYSKYTLNELLNFNYKDLIKNSFLVRDVNSSARLFQLCYKNKKIENNVVIEETKTTSQLSNLKNTLEIFDLSGLTMWCKCVNKSICYRNNELSFALQNIENLGIFIEYEEDETMTNLTPNQKIELMKNNLNKLGLNLGDDFSIKKPYLLLHKN